MITNNISLILYVTGIIIASMLLVFISPRLVFEKMLRVKVFHGTRFMHFKLLNVINYL
jgi:hypothetical protein